MSLNRENLTKLAEYLEQLPVDYPHFDMLRYETFDDFSDLVNYVRNGRDDTVWVCGTVACAVGHGPSAGILFTDNEMDDGVPRWGVYAERFSTDWRERGWMFTGLANDGWWWNWRTLDNTHRGAAARIRFLLDGNEVPDVRADITDLYSKYLVK